MAEGLAQGLVVVIIQNLQMVERAVVVLEMTCYHVVILYVQVSYVTISKVYWHNICVVVVVLVRVLQAKPQVMIIGPYLIYKSFCTEYVQRYIIQGS